MLFLFSVLRIPLSVLAVCDRSNCFEIEVSNARQARKTDDGTLKTTLAGPLEDFRRRHDLARMSLGVFGGVEQQAEDR